MGPGLDAALFEFFMETAEAVLRPCPRHVARPAGRFRHPVAVRHAADQSLAAWATAAQPHHLGIGGGLVDKHQPGRIKPALLSNPASACASDVGSLLFRRAQAPPLSRTATRHGDAFHPRKASNRTAIPEPV